MDPDTYNTKRVHVVSRVDQPSSISRNILPRVSCAQQHGIAAVPVFNPHQYFGVLRRDTTLQRSVLGATPPAAESTTVTFIRQKAHFVTD